MKGDVMVSVRLTPTEAQALDQLVSKEHYASRSWLLRDLIMIRLTEFGLKAEAWDQIQDERWARRRRRAPSKQTGLLPPRAKRRR